MRPAVLAFISLCGITTTAAAQQWSVEGHGSYARTTQTHTSSSGLGANVQALWGSQHAPVQLGTSVGPDWMKQQSGGPNNYSVSFDATLQPGGSSAVTPYVGGEISANWFSGAGAPSGTLAGFQYFAGVQLKMKGSDKTSLHLEVRPGYVQTQEHSITYRVGVAHQL